MSEGKASSCRSVVHTPPNYYLGQPLDPPFVHGLSKYNQKSPPTGERSWDFPAVYPNRKNELEHLRNDTSRSMYVKSEFDTGRLDKIYRWLWLAGRPMTARPLYKQVMLGRRIVITEQVDLHLLWQRNLIYIKPLPEFVMDRTFWEEHLCQNAVIHANTCGFLLSYIWLVSHASDFRIAQEQGLLPNWVHWTDWVKFTHEFLGVVDYQSLNGIGQRYHYGELRLNRINWIYRITGKSIIRGYLFGYNRYSTFFQSNLTWLAVVFLYMTVVLSAMQVGLGTGRLKNDSCFQNASAGFAVFSIMAPLIVVGINLCLLFILFLYNTHQTIVYKWEVERQRGLEKKEEGM